jgi:hypothetical protein
MKAFKLLKSNKEIYEEETGIQNDRSRLYALFSSWKLYVKERVLLKRYLIECGESPTDISLMSTGHLRENAASGHFSFRNSNASAYK